MNITGGTLTASARNTVLSQFGEVHIGASAHLMAAGEGKSAVQLIGAKMTLSGMRCCQETAGSMCLTATETKKVLYRRK